MSSRLYVLETDEIPGEMKMENEIVGVALEASQKLTVRIGKKASAVGSLKAASLAYRAYIDEENLGARDAKLCTVLDSAGGTIATVSYNGRVWKA